MNTAPTNSSLPVEDATDLLLLLLYAPGKTGQVCEPIEGTTRLQKLMFLLREGEGPRRMVAAAKKLGYSPYKMGPFSAELRDAVQDLVAADIINVDQLEYMLPDDADTRHDRFRSRTTSQGGITYKYYLSSTLGAQIGRDLWSGLDQTVQKELEEFKAFFNALSLRQLLIFTYEKFPAFTGRSTIKGQLGLQ